MKKDFDKWNKKKTRWTKSSRIGTCSFTLAKYGGVAPDSISEWKQMVKMKILKDPCLL